MKTAIVVILVLVALVALAILLSRRAKGNKAHRVSQNTYQSQAASYQTPRVSHSPYTGSYATGGSVTSAKSEIRPAVKQSTSKPRKSTNEEPTTGFFADEPHASSYTYEEPVRPSYNEPTSSYSTSSFSDGGNSAPSSTSSTSDSGSSSPSSSCD